MDVYTFMVGHLLARNTKTVAPFPAWPVVAVIVSAYFSFIYFLTLALLDYDSIKG